MENVLAILKSKNNIRFVLSNLLALAFIYSVPAVSHLLSFPLYLLDPMRIVIILAVVHTGKKNSYFAALSLPLFSFLISGHPVLEKMMIISSELMMNIWLYFEFDKRYANKFTAMFLSIVISKLFYYSVKFTLIAFTVMKGELVATPVYLQVVMTLVLSIYTFLIINKRADRKE